MTGQAHLTILGIETSCDETAAAVVTRDHDGRGRIVSNVVRSQIAEHAPFGGVVPELAARSHVTHLDSIIARSLEGAELGLADVDAIAATAGPGLIGGVLVGLTTAKALSAASGKPLIAVNHLEGHALTARLTEGIDFPYLMLLVSGGHSQYVLVRGVGNYTRWGTTIDDALGEGFDKVAKLLGLPYPGGPEVEAEAAKGDPKRFVFPRPLLREKRLDFSFSGLKTAVRLAAEKIAPLTETDIADISRQFPGGSDRYHLHPHARRAHALLPRKCPTMSRNSSLPAVLLPTRRSGQALGQRRRGDRRAARHPRHRRFAPTMAP